jgi:hypothetical protein
MFKSEPKKQVSKVDASGFLQSLIRIQHSLWRKETAEWELARTNALSLHNPNRLRLVEFYKDIDTDLFIRGQKNQRVNRIKNRKAKVINTKTGEEDKELTKLLQKKFFREFRQFVMDAKFYGHRLIYFTFDNKGRIKCKFVYPEHVIPEKGIIVKNPSDSTGISYLEGPFAQSFISVGEPEDLGMYENLAYPYLLRKHSWASWDEFEELFGVPLRWISTTATDKKLLDTLESFALEMGSANYAIVPGDAKMEVKEGRTQDAFQVFNEKRKAVNEEVSIYINGHAEQVNEKGSRGKSETIIHKTQDEISADDDLDVLTVVNDELLPMLAIMFGMPFGPDHEVVFDDTKVLEPKEKADLFKTVSDIGYEVDQEQITSELGVRITGKKTTQPLPPTEDKKKKNEDGKKPQNDAAAIIKMHADILAMYNHFNSETE